MSWLTKSFVNAIDRFLSSCCDVEQCCQLLKEISSKKVVRVAPVHLNYEYKSLLHLKLGLRTLCFQRVTKCNVQLNLWSKGSTYTYNNIFFSVLWIYIRYRSLDTYRIYILKNVFVIHPYIYLLYVSLLYVCAAFAHTYNNETYDIYRYNQ